MKLIKNKKVIAAIVIWLALAATTASLLVAVRRKWHRGNRDFVKAHIPVTLSDPWEIIYIRTSIVEGEACVVATIWSEHEPVFPLDYKRYDRVFAAENPDWVAAEVDSVSYYAPLRKGDQVEWAEYVRCDEGMFTVMRSSSGWYLAYQRSPVVK